MIPLLPVVCRMGVCGSCGMKVKARRSSRARPPVRLRCRSHSRGAPGYSPWWRDLVVTSPIFFMRKLKAGEALDHPQRGETSDEGEYLRLPIS